MGTSDTKVYRGKWEDRHPVMTPVLAEVLARLPQVLHLLPVQMSLSEGSPNEIWMHISGVLTITVMSILI